MFEWMFVLFNALQHQLVHGIVPKSTDVLLYHADASVVVKHHKRCSIAKALIHLEHDFPTNAVGSAIEFLVTGIESRVGKMCVVGACGAEVGRVETGQVAFGVGVISYPGTPEQLNSSFIPELPELSAGMDGNPAAHANLTPCLLDE